jgi:hypothetical protein
LTAWTAWTRESTRHEWRKLLTRDSEDGTLNDALDLAPGGDICILPSGVDPAHTLPRRQPMGPPMTPSERPTYQPPLLPLDPLGQGGLAQGELLADR